MNTILEKVTVFDAKTHLSDLLKKVQNGENFIITLRGKSIAKIVPFSEENTESIKSSIEELRKIRLSVKGKVNIKEMISEGRKY